MKARCRGYWRRSHRNESRNVKVRFVTVLRYDPDMATELTSLYNEAIASVPHCFPVSCEDLAATVGGKLKHTRRLRRLEPDVVFVAVQDGNPAGFIQISPENTRTGQRTDRGVIRFFHYRRGDRAIGQALLGKAHAYLEDLGVKKITAFHVDYRYPFYHQLSGALSNRMDHVQALLYSNNYGRTYSQVHFEWADFEIEEPSPTELVVDLELDWNDGRPARVDGGKSDSTRSRYPGLHLKAYLQGKLVGECGNDPYVETRDLRQLDDWFYVGWLGVEEPYQGKGLGRHLLRRSMQEMHTIGYRHAAISCSEENGRAFTHYSNCGFRIFDRTYSYERVSK